MPVTNRNLVSPGVVVSIILKQDQRSGHRTQGIVADVLTRRDHPRGIKVRLRDGQIGRVHDLTKPVSTQSQSHPPPTQCQQQPYALATMSQNQNPWQDQESVKPDDSLQRHQPILDQNNPWQQVPSTTHTQDRNTTQNYYQSPPNPPPSHQQQQHPSNPNTNSSSFPPHPPPRSQTQSEQFLPQGEERSEQLETLQNYEARAPMSEDDKNQAALQKEFPGVDSSLIAALYGDNKDVAEVREMLQELARG